MLGLTCRSTAWGAPSSRVPERLVGSVRWHSTHESANASTRLPGRAAYGRRMIRIGSSDLDVSRLCLGANVFGWTADREASFAVLDAYADAGGNFIDTADSYMWRA